ncbi:hypothetical protein GCM10007856_16940 [Azospirillum oryzae]|nr:hypothetical protein GCM10007856_16940 [Azospirillum oryzae]
MDGGRVMPHRHDTAAVCVIRQIRDHSRECHNLPAREVLLRVERRMIELLEDGPESSVSGSWQDHAAVSPM